MASIRKSFSFRNGVQVDEDNFIVNANGLVGIGTSIPTQNLDVRGTTKVVGLVTASDLFISGVATVTEIQVGTAITIASGVFSLNIFLFIIASIFARGLRFYIIALLLFIFGKKIRYFIEKYFNILVTLFFILLIGSVLLVKFI